MITEACWCSPTGRRSRARLIGADPPGGVATGEVVFNTVLTGYQEVITDPSLRRADHHLHLPPHRQLRRRPRPTTSRAGRSAAASSCASWPAGAATGAATDDLDALPAAPRRARHRRHRHPPPDPPHPRRRRHARRVRRRPTRSTLQGGGARPSPGTDGVDLVADGHHRRAVHASATGARPASWPTTSASSARSCATSASSATVEVVPASTPRGRRARPRSPTACSCPTARATRPTVPYADRRRSAACSATCRCSASAWATSSLARPSAPRPSSCRSATTAATTRCARSTTGQVEITSQNHNFAVDRRLARRRRRGDPRQPQRRRVRGHARARRPRLQRAVPPRGRARARTTASYLFDRVRRCSMGTALRRPERDAALMPKRTDIESILHHRLRADRDRPGLRVRLLGHAGLPRAARRGLPRRSSPTRTRRRS